MAAYVAHTKKKALYLSVSVFCIVVLRGHYFYVFNWRRARHFTMVN